MTIYLLDINLLLALTDPMHVHHELSHQWFAKKGRKAWATCPLTENGFVRIASHPNYPNRPGDVPAVLSILRQALGTAQGAFDRALAYVKQREQFGKKIAQFQVTQHKLADMATSIELARLITYKAAWNFDQGRIDPKLTSMAKMYAAKTAVEVCDEAIQLHGGYGYIAEYEVERFYRDAKICELYEGTKEIQKNTIASALIGKLK